MTSNSDLFPIEFIFLWAKTNLFAFPRRIAFKIVLALILFSSSSEKLDLHPHDLILNFRQCNVN